MRNIDVFNGDADGIIALLQLRLAKPCDSQLITGVKRDIQLLERVLVKPGDRVTVLDISLQRNHDALVRMLEQGASVFYVDHHQSGSIPQHPNLVTRIDQVATQCTSTLMDSYLEGAFRTWAIAAAFGDNLTETALQLASQQGLSDAQIGQLRELGILLNYNGYGQHLDDLHIHPALLFRQLLNFRDPFELMMRSESIFTQLQRTYHEDMNKTQMIQPHYQSEYAALYQLPAERWSRRVSGVYSNELANSVVGRAHAVVTDNGDGTCTISVRAPVNNRQGADVICSQFPNGGGRSAAAGINQLPLADIGQFWQKLNQFYQSMAQSQTH
ncbi:DHH family phosphoesterase [Celerinatantimonas yamalensis]|uniref:DHH family phosphoesterase n=1 Tax=Celerinatantimonas yamalensis TaxID=559956 RepID=A0ABW9G637_9GAMM